MGTSYAIAARRQLPFVGKLKADRRLLLIRYNITISRELRGSEGIDPARQGQGSPLGGVGSGSGGGSGRDGQGMECRMDPGYEIPKGFPPPHTSPHSLHT